MGSGGFIVASACALSLLLVATGSAATSIDEISTAGVDPIGGQTLVMADRPGDGVRCLSRAREICSSTLSRPLTQWAQASILEVATEPSALQTLLEREWMRRLESVEARYSLPAAEVATSTPSR